MTERRAVGAPVIQVERELDVRPDQLAHERSMRAGRAGQGPPCEGSSLTRKCASCGARSRCCGAAAGAGLRKKWRVYFAKESR